MADLYKEYLMHVPAKWTGFAHGGVRLRSKELSFGSCLPRTAAESHELVEELEASEEARGARARGARRRRAGDSWAAEMKQLVNESRLKAEAERNAAALEEALRVKHQRFMASKEKAMAPPSIEGKPMPVAFHSLRDVYPDATARYQAMLSAAGDLALAEARATVDAKAAAMESKQLAAQLAHLARVDAGVQRAAEERVEQTKHHAAHVAKAMARTSERRRDLAEKADKERKEMLAKTQSRDMSVAARLEAEAMERDRLAALAAHEADEKLRRMRAQKAERAAAFEQELQHKFEIVEERRAIVETMRHQAAASKEGERILSEVHERREKQREAQLQALDAAAKRREARRDAASVEREEAHKDLVQVHHRREERVDEGKEKAWEQREKTIEFKLNKTHEEPRPFRPRERRTPAFIANDDQCLSFLKQSASTPAPGPSASASSRLRSSSPLSGRAASVTPSPGIPPLTDARLLHAAALKRRLQEEDERRRSELADKRDVRDTSIFSKQLNDHHSNKQRLVTQDEHNFSVRERAAQRELERQAAVDNEVAKRAAEAEKHLQEVREQQARETRDRANERAKKTAKCLDEVNVHRQKASEDRAKSKAEKRAQFEQEQRAEQEQAAARQRALHEERTARMDQLAAEAAQQREELAQRRRLEHDAKVAAAVAARERQIAELQEKLAEAERQRAAKVAAASEHFEQTRQSLRTRLVQQDDAHETALEALRLQEARERRNDARRREEVAERALDTHLDLHSKKIHNALSKAAYAHNRAHTSLEVRREALKSISPPPLARSRSEEPPGSA